MEILLGKHVETEDGQTIGTVDRLVYAPETKTFVEFIVHHGQFLTTDRLVERGVIKDIDADGGVHLSLTAQQADDLPGFVQEHYVVPAAIGHMPGGGLMSMGSLVMIPEDDGAQEVRSNVPSDDALIDSGTDVVDSDNQRLGNVSGLAYDTDGAMTGLIVKTGHVRHQTLQVPRAAVHSVSGEQVLLDLLADQLETPHG